ncbi:hypothetical protein JYK14_21945 [Siccirubricoccus sp. KC 17139]|uniref:Uncharacterized protein n=1 Tax=Siccirubricoccus soli TaxID=2899147 RepID=A0ABT1DCX7_9PROT|nr:hypothetical protein [Siccirubricoccus soli]MCO6418800.1 hypothetical protein [Siccirubricoccus soli]MCP2684935.1 hypothetical protein [Siccirubricoccus soli]
MLILSAFLRRVLWLDAASCLGMGLLLAGFAGPLGGFLHLPIALLRESGLFLLLAGAALAWMASRSALPRWLLWVVILGNALWALDSLLLLPLGWVAPNLLGEIFLVVQALFVALLAMLEYRGLQAAAAQPA